MLQNLIANGQSMRTVSLPRGRQRLHAMPTSAGYEVRENEVYDWDGRRRGQTPFTVLQHTISGTGRLRYQNRNYRLQSGDTLLVLVPHNHRYWLEKGDRWEYFWISMNGEETLRIHKMVLGLAGPVLRLQPSTIDHLADCSLRLIKGAATPGAASAIAYEAAMALYDDVFGSPAFAADLSVMQPVIDHINANLEQPLPVERTGKHRRPQPRAFFPQLRGKRRRSARRICASAAAATGGETADESRFPAGQGGLDHVRL